MPLASCNYREGGSSSSGSALPPPPAPLPLEPSPLEKRGLDQETAMTDATVEQQGEPKRRKEHPEMPQATDSSGSSSSSSESSTVKIPRPKVVVEVEHLLSHQDRHHLPAAARLQHVDLRIGQITPKDQERHQIQ